MNYVGLVQEHCQKKNLPLPVYEECPNDRSLFNISVKLRGVGRTDLFNGTGKNKKEAKMEAARLAFEYIDSNKTKIMFDVPTYLAIDIENVGHCFQELEMVKLSGPVKVVGYYSESWVSQLPRDINDGSGLLDTIKIPSSRKDASDIGMIMSLTQVAMSNEYSQIIIWTKDHYGAVVKEILESGFLGCKAKVVVYHSLV